MSYKSVCTLFMPKKVVNMINSFCSKAKSFTLLKGRLRLWSAQNTIKEETALKGG